MVGNCGVDDEDDLLVHTSYWMGRVRNNKENASLETLKNLFTWGQRRRQQHFVDYLGKNPVKLQRVRLPDLIGEEEEQPEEEEQGEEEQQDEEEKEKKEEEEEEEEESDDNRRRFPMKTTKRTAAELAPPQDEEEQQDEEEKEKEKEEEEEGESDDDRRGFPMKTTKRPAHDSAAHYPWAKRRRS